MSKSFAVQLLFNNWISTMMNRSVFICVPRFIPGLIAASILSSLVAIQASAKIEFDSNQLIMKTADQVATLVQLKIKKAQAIQAKQENEDDGNFVAEPEALEQLKDAMRIVLARPDQDGTRGNAFSRLRRELIDLNSLDKVLEDLTTEAILAIKSDNTKVVRAATYVVLLDNLMAELKPEVKTNEPFKRLVVQIRDADLKISDKLKNEQRLHAMSNTKSPSETAATIVPKAAK
jgi:hypothetical protein